MMLTFALTANEFAPMYRFFEPISLADQVRNTPLLIYAVFFLSLAGAYLALWWTAPDFRVFRNMGAYLALVGVQVLSLYFFAGAARTQWAQICFTSAVLVMIAGEAMRIPHRRWASLIWPICMSILTLGWFPGFQFLRPLPVDLSQAFVLILTIQGFRKGQERDRQIAAAFAFLVAVRWTLSLWYQDLTHLPRAIEIGGWRWTLNPISLIMLGTATLVIYVRDLIQDRREKQRFAAELAAGRAIQQVLIPAGTPTIPGFRIQSVYMSAGEVGGDFFQILPLDHGSVLVAIGDVSGKGMPAALMVSLLVGALQTLADTTTSPAKILFELNRRLLGRSAGGFTTCLALRADSDGTLTLANAGHIPPYVDGKELHLENGLPLGLSADAAYAESTLQLNSGRQLTMVTDGVVEARDKTGTLFGFERTAELSNQAADAVARIAQEFGQDDDITVLTIERATVPEPEFA